MSKTEPANERYQVPAALRTSLRALSMVAPPVAATVAWRMFAKPQRRPAPDRYGVFSEATPLTLRAEGHDLKAWEWGEGTPVLLLHGWSSSSRRLGGFVRPLVDAGHRVIAYDAHGHGESPGGVTSGPEMARHLVEIARALDVRQVVAHSMGTVVTGFAMRQGWQPTRVVLLNAPADMPYFLSLFTRALGFTEPVERRMIQRFEREHSIAWENCTVEAVVGGTPVRALLVHDEQDPDVPWPHAERVRNAWGNHHAVTTRGLGHRGALKAEPVIAASVDFLLGEYGRLPEVVEAG